MKVKDLISKLEKLNPELEVVVQTNSVPEDFRPLNLEEISVIRGVNIMSSPLHQKLFDCSPTYAGKSEAEKLVSLSGPTWASKRNKE